ncbi:zinc-binding dehydrogenase [Chryseobacterium sp. MYb264]|uniref:alcohol dehydrogenase catalytic domain-containing protein n=1 Tax=Chryseobacterium sp. MYb264 TaxID=2745153 RepID=UPI002E14FBFA|nr:zinc-binding dehydrogenase [Chryseobacterium sp. MYb264]
MKAVYSTGPGDQLDLVEIPIPQPREGEVVVKLKAAGVNRRDLLISKGSYVNLKYPIVLGSDGSGIIEIIGENVDGVHIGDEVIINPAINWGDNQNFPSTEYRILGLPDNGTYAEYVVVPASAIYSKPLYLNFEQAAAIPLSGLTGYRALISRGKACEGQKVLITGIGGAVAQFMLQFALAIGTEVYFTSGDKDKITKAIDLGASGGVMYKEDDWDKQLLELAGGFDVIIDTAAGKDFEKLFDIANPGANIVLFGATAGPIPQILPQKIYLKQLNILGTSMGSDIDFIGMLDLVNKHKLIPVIDEVLPLKDAQSALDKLSSSSQFGKIVLSINH